MNNTFKNSTIKNIAAQAVNSMREGALSYASLLDATSNAMDEDQRRNVSLASLSITSGIDNNVAILKSLMGSNHYDFPFSVELLDYVTKLTHKAWSAVAQWRKTDSRPHYRIPSDLYRCCADLEDMFKGEEPGQYWDQAGFKHWGHLASSIEGVK